MFLFDLVGCTLACYSQTGCSFDGNLANFRRNLGNLIDSLSGASCNPRQQVTTCASKLVSSLTSWLRLVVIYKMFQVLLQYFEDRFASFYVEEPVNNYNELLDRVKKAIPVLRGVGNEQIVVSYKDVSLQTFINIDRDETLHVLEAFRNASPCASEIYRRVHLKVRESDSPFLLKRRSNLAGTSAESTSTTQPKSLLASFASSVNSERSAVEDVCDWKISKGNQLTQKLQSLNDSKLAVETHIRELEIDVVEPPHVGGYATMICGNCHIRGHRAEGNRGNGSCKSPPCNSYISCGQKKKHPEYFEEIRNMKKQLKDLQKEIDTVTMEKKNFDSFQSKSISAFSSAITPRLAKAFPEKYSIKTAKGKLELQKDIATLRLACANKIPLRADSISDRELFTSLLDKQRKIMNEVYAPVDVKASANGNQTTVNFAVSPVRTERRQKRSRSPSSESSEESESSPERKHKRRKKKSHRRKKSSRSKKSRKKRRKYDSSSESEDNHNRSKAVSVKKKM